MGWKSRRAAAKGAKCSSFSEPFSNLSCCTVLFYREGQFVDHKFNFVDLNNDASCIFFSFQNKE